MDWTAIWLSIRLASLTTLILLLVGMPIAHWLAFSPRKWKVIVESVIALPLVLPPTVLGFYLLSAMSPESLLGRAWGELTGGVLPFSFAGLLIASVLYSTPFAVQPILSGFAGVDPELIGASTSLGASRLRTFTRVIAPLSKPSIVTAGVLTFAHTLGEFGVVLMVGGNIAGRTRTISISIYDNVQSLDMAAAGRTSLALLVFSFVVLSATYALQRRVWAVWPGA